MGPSRPIGPLNACLLRDFIQCSSHQMQVQMCGVIKLNMCAGIRSACTWTGIHVGGKTS